MGNPGTQEVGDRIEALLGELREQPNPLIAQTAEEIIRLLMGLYGEGLERLCELIEPDEVRRLSSDPTIMALLLLHDLHPLTLEQRVDAALEAVRPYLGSHAGGVTLTGIDAEAGVVTLQLEGSCDGCGASAETVRNAIEQSVKEFAPEILTVEAEGATTGGLQQLHQIGPAPQRAWTRIEGLRLLPGQAVAVEVDGAGLVVCAVAGGLYAYTDRCAACGTALGGDCLFGAELRCHACSATFDARAAGRSTNGDGLQLRPVPLLPDEGAVKVAIPAAARA